MAAKTISTMKNKRNDNNQSATTTTTTVENRPTQKKRKLSHLITENDDNEMYVSFKQFCCNDDIQKEKEQQEPPMIIDEEEEMEPSLAMEPAASNAIVDDRINGSNHNTFQSIKPEQHIRGKDLNRLLQQHHDTDLDMSASPINDDQSYPSFQGMESFMGRHFYPIDSIEEED